MKDPQIFERINELAAEEERLYAGVGDGSGLDNADTARLETIKVELDQCYDLLHQREARRSTGLDPDAATVRSPDVVERYQQ
jgi:hypothetical protein